MLVTCCSTVAVVSTTLCVLCVSSKKCVANYTEFIHLLASEASEISEKQQKKVISAEHVVEALKTLGFQEYIEDVKAVHREYKEQASVGQSRVLVLCLRQRYLETSHQKTWQRQVGKTWYS